MSKLLIIGAGIGQVELLKKAKARGVWVAVATKPGDYPCIKLADALCPFDIYDRDAIVAWAIDNGITAVMSDQNDLTMPTVAYVANKLGVPGNPFDGVWTYCNKNLFRSACDKAGVPTPRHVQLVKAAIPEAFKDIPFPWIVKPEDSQSSIGVTKIANAAEFESAAKLALEKSRNGKAILEEFFTGREVVCEGMVCNGKYYHLAFGDRRYFDLPNLMIPSQTIFATDLDQKHQDQIIQYETNLSKTIGLRFSILHSEYLINEATSEIRIVETGPRGGGVYISSHLIPAATGIDITDLVLRFALGEQVDMDAIFAVRQNGASAYICFYLPIGTIVSVEGVDAIKANPNVIASYLSGIEVGTKTEPMLYKGARKGPILVRASSRSQLEEVINGVKETLKIKVATDNGSENSVVWG